MKQVLLKVLQFIKEIFCDEKGRVSSKRVSGFIGNMCVFGCYVYCSVKGLQLPSATTEVVIASSALMGIDSAVKPFKKTTTKKSDS